MADLRRAAAVTAGAALALLALDRLFPFPFERLGRAPAIAVLDRDGTPLRIFLPPDQKWRTPVSLSEVPPALVAALVASEDRFQRFHPGVNPLSAARAALANLRARRVVSGASTLAMQIARMIEPKPRTLPAKVWEAFRALQLEARLSKREILETYLNLAPYGGNVEGIGAASWSRFGKPPSRLALGEIALLTALPRSPNRFDPVRHPEAALLARNRVLRQLLERGVIGAGEFWEAFRQPLPRTRPPLPFEAPHLAQYALDAHGRAGEPVRTTLDRRVQRAAEQAVARRIAELRSTGIGNAAAVVIEIDSRAVRALVGSAGFYDEARAGQVNGALARRAPGSTLKPFLFALALDRGLLAPDSYLLDIPTDFSGYVAENYDGVYRGRVTVREALVRSLNAPAVRLLSQIGLDPFLDFLRRGGLDTLDRPAAAYGLPLILGAGEVTLLELTNLYATLASGGAHRAFTVLEAASAAPAATQPLTSPEAARLVLEMLTGIERPDLPQSWELARDAFAVAWKTGTSYGHRDAWAVGVSPRYAIGVWVGNFDGSPVKGISGSRHAGPLLFDLLRGIDRAGPFGAVPRPPGLRIGEIEVCSLSHERPGPFCPRTERLEQISSRTRLPVCAQHRRIFVDSRTGEALAGRCLGSRPHRARVVEVHPPELLAWWRAQGIAVSPLPALSASCGGQPPGEAPSIVSPNPATPYRLRRDAPVEFQKIALAARVSAHASPENGHLFWYQDGRLVASGSPGAPIFVRPVAGAHKLVVVDETGRSDNVTYLVEE